MLKQKIREFNEDDEDDVVEVDNKKDTTSIINIKNKIESKKKKQETAIKNINKKIEAKESKLEGSAKRLLSKLSCDKRLKTQQVINKMVINYLN